MNRTAATAVWRERWFLPWRQICAVQWLMRANLAKDRAMARGKELPDNGLKDRDRRQAAFVSRFFLTPPVSGKISREMPFQLASCSPLSALEGAGFGWQAGNQTRPQPLAHYTIALNLRRAIMHGVIYLIGLIVVVLAILNFIA